MISHSHFFVALNLLAALHLVLTDHLATSPPSFVRRAQCFSRFKCDFEAALYVTLDIAERSEREAAAFRKVHTRLILLVGCELARLHEVCRSMAKDYMHFAATQPQSSLPELDLR